jgi:hypothetical protein
VRCENRAVQLPAQAVKLDAPRRKLGEERRGLTALTVR